MIDSDTGSVSSEFNVFSKIVYNLDNSDPFARIIALSQLKRILSKLTTGKLTKLDSELLKGFYFSKEEKIRK